MADNPYQSPRPLQSPADTRGILTRFAAVLRGERRPPVPRCSFCSALWEKNRPFVEGAGPNRKGGVFICRECIRLCAAILNDELRRLDGQENEGRAAEP